MAVWFAGSIEHNPDPPRSEMMSESCLRSLPVHCWWISDRLQIKRFGRGRPMENGRKVTLTKAMSTNLISSGTTARGR